MDEWTLLRSTVLLRDGHRCVASLPIRCWGDLDPHHVWRRGQGGPDIDTNLVTLSRSCHRYVHDNPLIAQCAGLLVPAWTGLAGLAVTPELRQRARHRLMTFAPWLTATERQQVWEQLPNIVDIPLRTVFDIGIRHTV